MSEKHRNFIGFILYWGLILLLCWIGVRYVLLWRMHFIIEMAMA